ARLGARISAPRDHHCGVPRGPAATRPRPRRLQPECVGADTGVHLFGAPPPGRDRVDADHVAAGPARRAHRGLHDAQRPGASREAWRSLETPAPVPRPLRSEHLRVIDARPQLFNYPITRLLDYPITRFPSCLIMSYYRTHSAISRPRSVFLLRCLYTPTLASSVETRIDSGITPRNVTASNLTLKGMSHVG